MSGVNEILEVGAWIKTRIESTTSLKAFADKIPDNESLPAVRFLPQQPRDTRVLGNGGRILTKIDWLVVVVNAGLGITPLVPLANAVDAALEDQNGSTATVLVLQCQRQEPFTLLELDRTGASFRHAGGIYRTTVQKV